MMAVIISDIHDNLANLAKCLDYCRAQNITTMICCGDITNSDTVDYLAKNFAGTIHLIMGNVDNFDDGILTHYRNIRYYDRKGGHMIMDGKRIGFCHEPYHVKHLFAKGMYDIIFYGHTHKPWESQEHGVRLINPGTLGGVFQKATFAVWDSETGEVALQILETM
ncbi:MAG: YfcE family phosphodiesterase [Candidatus Falkowbacteria bacterium]